MGYTPVRGREPLRVPHGWTDQSRSLVVQLERIFDDIYKRFRKTRKEDLDEDILEMFDEIDGRLDTAEGNISGLTTRMGTAEGNITSLGGRMDTAEGKITALEGIYGLTVTQLKGK